MAGGDDEVLGCFFDRSEAMSGADQLTGTYWGKTVRKFVRIRLESIFLEIKRNRIIVDYCM